jgi:hypothetical protein
MTTLSILKKAAGIATLALGVGASALIPAPAMAQSFGFSFGNDNGRFGFHIGDDDNFRPGYRCVSRNRLDDMIERQGYRHVRITDWNRRTVEAVGQRGRYLYAIEANACTGRIYDTDRLRRV